MGTGKLQRRLGGCAATLIGGFFCFFAAVSGAQQPPVKPFDPRQLDEATRNGYYLHLMPYLSETIVNSPAGKQITVSLPIYAAQQDVPPEQAEAQAPPAVEPSDRAASPVTTHIPSTAPPSIEPFDPRQLDEATRNGYYLHLMPYLSETIVNSPAGKQITVSLPIYAAQQGITPEQAEAQAPPVNSDGNVIVATFSCNLNTHHPHIGTFPRTVKAKADGNCIFTPTGVGEAPPRESTRWVLVMSLSGVSTSGTGMIFANLFIRTGHEPTWRQNLFGRGTQVDSGLCINGTYKNKAFIALELPPRWSADPIAAMKESQTVVISGCPSPSRFNSSRSLEETEEDIPPNDRIWK